MMGKELEKKRVLQKRNWKTHVILKIKLINKTRQKKPHPFHLPYIYQNLHSKSEYLTNMKNVSKYP